MNHRFRTLARVVGEDRDGVWVTLPAWNHKLAVLFDWDFFPEFVRTWQISAGYRFYCTVILGAKEAELLAPEDFEEKVRPSSELAEAVKKHFEETPAAEIVENADKLLNDPGA